VKKVIIIAGPTAVGKTDLTLSLAEKLNSEIISADSMQIYRGMDIGSAKPDAAELSRVPHHLIDCVNPDEPFTVADFRRRAFETIDHLLAAGKTPIVAGGTGLYINALLYAMDFSNTGSDSDFRDAMQRFADENGPDALFQKLAEKDPSAAAAIHPNNIKRVIRALEIAEIGGEKKGDFRQGPALNTDYSFDLFCLTRERSELYDRINIRVDRMMDKGLMEEVRRLYEAGCTPDMPAMQGIGYKELMNHLKGNSTLDEAVQMIKQHSRNYAKRQLTWFRRYETARWMDLSGLDRYEQAAGDLFSLIH
jgi:tRNA dimethylallyltransferase